MSRKSLNIIVLIVWIAVLIASLSISTRAKGLVLSSWLVGLVSSKYLLDRYFTGGGKLTFARVTREAPWPVKLFADVVGGGVLLFSVLVLLGLV